MAGVGSGTIDIHNWLNRDKVDLLSVCVSALPIRKYRNGQQCVGHRGSADNW